MVAWHMCGVKVTCCSEVIQILVLTCDVSLSEELHITFDTTFDINLLGLFDVPLCEVLP